MQWPCIGSAHAYEDIFTCFRICVFIYESGLQPYSKNDFKRLIRIEKIEQDNIKGREHKFEESRK